MTTSSRAAPGLGSRLGASAKQTARSLGSLRLLEFVLFFLLIVSERAGEFVPALQALPTPASNLVLLAICAAALLQKPQNDLGRAQILVPLIAVALGYLGVVSLLAESSEFAAPWEYRLLRMAAVTVLVFVLASGRLDPRSAIVGTMTALIVNIPIFYSGMLTSSYGSNLTGLIADKNVAGLTYCLVGLLVVWAARRPWTRTAVIVFTAAALWLTGSRTSIAAFAGGLVWIVLAPRLPMFGRWILGLLIAIGVEVVGEDYSRIGVFSNRTGSDLLRSRIDAASQIKVGDTGFFGSGLGEAYVVFPDDPTHLWFFHNSYWTMLVEGGWPWAIVIVALTVLVVLRPFSPILPHTDYAVQAAGLALLICAGRLGEVFFTTNWGLVVGTALYLMVRREPSDPSHLSTPTTRFRPGVRRR